MQDRYRGTVHKLTAIAAKSNRNYYKIRHTKKKTFGAPGMGIEAINMISKAYGAHTVNINSIHTNMNELAVKRQSEQ